MNQKRNDRPPHWMLAFFRWFCRPEYREDIEGDLLERFHNHSTTMGPGRAKWLFLKELLFLMRPGLIRNSSGQHQQKLNDMKRSYCINLLMLNLLVVLMIVSPFIPGPSNKLVGVASFLGQLTGVFGLLLVPVGLVWTIIERRNMKVGSEKQTNPLLHYQLAFATAVLIALIFLAGVLFVPNPMPKTSFFIGLLLVLSGFILALRQIRIWQDKDQAVPDHGAQVILAAIAISCVAFICLFAALCVFVVAGVIPGVLAVLLFSIGLYRAIKSVQKLRDHTERKFNRLPLYFLTMPLIAFLAFTFLMKPASDFSRSYAIKRGEALIASIEDHKMRTGRYPGSIDELYPLSAGKRPTPFIMGIGDFRYHKINDHYSVSFSQWLKLSSLEEIVLYDKNEIARKKEALPPYTYEHDLHRINGAFAAYNTRHSNWRYYHVD